MRIIFILLCACANVSMFEIVLENVEMVYYNPKYLNSVKIVFTRLNRKSPYILNLYQNLKVGMGNNLTIKWTMFEVIGGHHVLTPLHFEYRLCDFLNKDPYIGKMVATQLPKNWVCPFPPGKNDWLNMVMHFEYLPFIPFTYSSLFVRACASIEGEIVGESLYRANIYGVIKQKLKDNNSKKKTQ